MRILPKKYWPVLFGLLSLIVPIGSFRQRAVWTTPFFWFGIFMTLCGILVLLQGAKGMERRQWLLRDAAGVLAVLSGIPMIVSFFTSMEEQIAIHSRPNWSLLVVGAVPILCGAVSLFRGSAQRRTEREGGEPYRLPPWAKRLGFWLAVLALAAGVVITGVELSRGEELSSRDMRRFLESAGVLVLLAGVWVYALMKKRREKKRPMEERLREVDAALEQGKLTPEEHRDAREKILEDQMAAK